MRRLLAGVCLIAAAAASPAAENLRPGDFAALFPLGNVAEGLNAVELSEAVYRAATERSLGDLRIFNAKDEALPLAVLPPLPEPAPDVRVLELTMAPLPAASSARDAALRAYALRFERDHERAVFEVQSRGPRTEPSSPEVGGYLIDARQLKDRKGRLLLVFAPNAADYAGRAELLGSEDLVNWWTLAHGPLAREGRLGETIERNRFDLNRPPSFLRVTWSGATAPQIAAARFEEPLSAIAALPRALLSTTLGNERRSLYADLPPALPTERLFIRMLQSNTAERFTVYRHVPDPGPPVSHLGLLPRRAPQNWVAAGTIDAFRVTREGLEIEGRPLVFSMPTDGVRIDATRPLGAVPTLEAEWRPARIAFAARAPGPYRLAVGRQNAGASAALDLKAMLPADDAAGARLPVARIESFASSPQGAEETVRAARIAAQAHWSRVLLWSVLALAVLGLAWMAWRLAAQLRAPSTPPADARR